MPSSIQGTRRFVNLPLAPSAIDIITHEAGELGVSKGAYVSMVILGRLSPPCRAHRCASQQPALEAEDFLQADDSAA